jgi:CRISPR-associated protein Cas5
MENEIDISNLFEKPVLNKQAILWIEPLAPLSMVVSMPGSYYRSQGEPSPFMIYGMLENMLGWHFDDKIRRDILKKMKTEFSKKYKIKELSSESSEVSYTPILQQHVKIEAPALFQPQKTFFEDYWTQHLKDVDERHAKGNRNYDVSLEVQVNNIYSQPKEDRDKLWRTIFEKNNKLFPNYYQSPTKREFVATIGKYGFKIITNESLLNLLIETIDQTPSSPIYIGTNEGWIDLQIQKL